MYEYQGFENDSLFNRKPDFKDGVRDKACQTILDILKTKMANKWKKYRYVFGFTP